MRGTTVLDIEFLTVGDNTQFGWRCLLDARGGLYVGNNVTIASDVHIIGGGHDVQPPRLPADADPHRHRGLRLDRQPRDDPAVASSAAAPSLRRRLW